MIVVVLERLPADLVNRIKKVRTEARKLAAEAWSGAGHAETVRANLGRFDLSVRERICAVLDHAAGLATAEDGGAESEQAQERRAKLEATLAGLLDDAMDPLREHLKMQSASATLPPRSVISVLRAAVHLYEHLLPRAQWPSVLVVAEGPEAHRALVRALSDADLLDDEAQGRRLAHLGLLHLAIPAEPDLLPVLARLDGVRQLADPDAVVARAEVRVSTADEASDLHGLLNVPRWAPKELGENVRVALLTSGSSSSHPDLRRVEVRDFTGEGMSDELGLGSHLCGIVCGDGSKSDGVFMGIAPHARVHMAKVADRGGDVTLGRFVAACDWAIREARCDILVLPLEDAGNRVATALMHAVCESALKQGLLVVTGAGDTGPATETIQPPGDMAEVISVGALDRNGRLATLSGRGDPRIETTLFSKPDCVAPGVDVAGPRASSASSLREFDEHGAYTLLTGTAPAAAVLAGCLALTLSAARETHGEATRACQIRGAFFKSCRAVAEASPTFETGFGLPDVMAAIGEVQSNALNAYDIPLGDDENRGGGGAGTTQGQHHPSAYEQHHHQHHQHPHGTGTATSSASQVALTHGQQPHTGDPAALAAAGTAVAEHAAGARRRRRAEAAETEPELDVPAGEPPSESTTEEVDFSAAGDDDSDAGGLARARQMLDELESRNIDLDVDALGQLAAQKAREQLGLTGDETEDASDIPGHDEDDYDDYEAEGNDVDDDNVFTAQGVDETPEPAKAAGTRAATNKSESTQHERHRVPEGAVEADTARRLETEFLDGFEARFYNLQSVPNPLEAGRRYEIHTTGESTNFFSDRDELKELLLKHGTGDLRHFPHNKGLEIAIVRKRLFGPKQKKIAFVGACYSPLAEMVEKGYSKERASRRRMVQMVERCLGDPNCYYFLGLFATTGWSADAKDANVTGTNYSVFLLECEEEFGFRVYAPSNLDPVVRQAFDPEDDVTKLNRARRRLQSEAQLRSPGGFLLIEELAENCNVPEGIARKAAEEYAAKNAEIRLEVVDSTLIVRRQRF